MKRLAIAGGALLVLAGCNSSGNSTYAQAYQLMRQSIAASFGHVRVTEKQAADIPYASLGFRIDDGNEQIVVLATDTGGDLLWTSAARIVLVTRAGRLVRTVGLDHDLAALTTRDSSPLPPPSAALAAPFASTRLQDFPDMGRYGVAVTCRAAAKGPETIRILGHAIPTTRVDEACESPSLKWSFVNTYWVDNSTGLAWRTRQRIHPSGGVIETTIFRPPA